MKPAPEGMRDVAHIDVCNLPSVGSTLSKYTMSEFIGRLPEIDAEHAAAAQDRQSSAESRTIASASTLCRP